MSASHLANAPSTAIMVERKGKFFFYQPELGVIASGAAGSGQKKPGSALWLRRVAGAAADNRWNGCLYHLVDSTTDQTGRVVAPGKGDSRSKIAADPGRDGRHWQSD